MSENITNCNCESDEFGHRINCPALWADLGYKLEDNGDGTATAVKDEDFIGERPF
jgi:hypothetical protein